MNIRKKIFGGEGAVEEPILKPKKPKGARRDALDSVVVPREESRKTNTRGGDRHRLFGETMRIDHDGRSYDVELINVSGGGAMISGGFAPKLWDSITLHLGENGTIECAVRWIRAERVGLEFAHETRIDCAADKQAAVLREVIQRSFPEVEFELSEETLPDHDGPDGRAARRHPLVWSGLLHHDYQSTPVRIRNISESGAMIECAAPLRVGSEPLLELSDALAVSATVAWVVGDQVGLQFHNPFDLHDLARSRPEVAGSDWVPPSYLDTGVSSDSPWSRMSLGELRQQLEGFMKH
ncbi:MAG TPA: PilZ domain-containing protein [Sphingomicrobium sp.]|jgi:hypothetical protein|nr:PilZ domain-containing protein [Sphingomicrobium sp.]